MILYIDGTTGGMALQILLSGAVGGLVLFKLAAKRVMRTFFPNRFAEEEYDDEDEDLTPEAEDSKTRAA